MEANAANAVNNRAAANLIGNEPDAGLFDDSPKIKANNYQLQDQDNREMNEDEDLFGGDDHHQLERGHSLGGGLMPSGGLARMDSNISNPGAGMPYQARPQDDLLDKDQTPSLSAFINPPAEPEPEVSGIHQKAQPGSDDEDGLFGDSDQEDDNMNQRNNAY